MPALRTSSITTLLSVVLLSLALSACGFKLQRSYQIPEHLSQLHLASSDQYSELTRLLSDRLRVNSIDLVDANKQTPTLRLINDSLERATLSLYPNGNVAEYELIYHVNYSVALPDGEPEFFETAIRRDYKDDPRTALAKSREMELLVKEMRQQAADRIVQTLATIN
ncbi:hypothetical protein G3R49_03125 [Shewanella sp. WXL01]|uniref:LPS-assembly lipoprotein LptE n=1 Tax=Shewanella maritima TaxID=2520507 RepID=A0A411PFF6_9GAMM|nr:MULTISPECIES: LPS assembly lipoprotein LptE [Shewanella]NKF49574.1 hypothetical protein [Shewanella sp. WXL01]QBF82327.1 hypothetical protein EXU30_06180 [Shewanella maritima]